MGRKKKPTAIHIAQGTHQPCRHGDPESEPQFVDAGSAPVAPDWLGEHGRAVWAELAPQLSPQGCLTNVDLPAFACYCEAWDELRASLAAIEIHGRIATSEKGGSYQHPAVGIKNKAIARIRDFSHEFGLTPSARAGLNVKAVAASVTEGKGRFFAG